MTEPDLRLKTARVPIGRLHYHKAKHREGKVLRRTHHDRSGSQLPVIRKRVPEKHLGSYHLCDYRPPEKSFGCGAVHCRLFQQLRTVEPRHRKLKASDNSYGRTFLYLAAGARGVAAGVAIATLQKFIDPYPGPATQKRGQRNQITRKVVLSKFAKWTLCSCHIRV